MTRREILASLAILPVAAAVPTFPEEKVSLVVKPPWRPGEFLVTDDVLNSATREVEWKEAQPVDSVWVHSRGGSAFFGVWLAHEVQKAGIPVHVAGVALGIAALLPILAARSSMHPHGFLMLMNCWATVVGSAEMRRTADLLKMIDSSIARGIARACTRRGHDTEPDRVLEWMAENTWFNAPEALAAGLITEIKETA